MYSLMYTPKNNMCPTTSHTYATNIYKGLHIKGTCRLNGASIPFSPEPICVEARLFLSSAVALTNSRRHVQSRQLNSCELDVTLIYSSDCNDGLRSEGVELRQ